MGTTRHQEIRFQRDGQMFVLDPDGPPTRLPPPRARVFENGAEIAATVGACSVDPVFAVVHGDTVVGATTLGVASIGGIVVGGRYLVTARSREWIQVVAIRAAESRLVLRYPLVHRYEDAATIQGCRLSIGVDPAWSAEFANLSDTPHRAHGRARYAVHWEYAIDGVEHSTITYADLVSTLSRDLVTPAVVDSRFQGFIANLPPEHRVNLGADLITEAFRAVRIEAANDDEHRRLRDPAVLRELVVLRTNVLRIDLDVMHGRRPADDLVYAERSYRATYAQLVELPRFAGEASSSEILSPRVARKVTNLTPRRIPKLTRF